MDLYSRSANMGKKYTVREVQLVEVTTPVCTSYFSYKFQIIFRMDSVASESPSFARQVYEMSIHLISGEILNSLRRSDFGELFNSSSSDSDSSGDDGDLLFIALLRQV